MPRRKFTQAFATARSQESKCTSWAIERLYIERKFVFRIVYYCLDENLRADIAMLNNSRGQSERRLWKVIAPLLETWAE
jgi:siderophore synthetase component